MEFLLYVEEARQYLPNRNYVETLWGAINNEELSFAVEDEELYIIHLPLDMNTFLVECCKKLNKIKITEEELDISNFDVQYILTLIYYTLDLEENPLNNDYYAGYLFILLNLLNKEDTFFYETIYLKTLNALDNYRKTQDMSGLYIITVLDDLKSLLRNYYIPNCLEDTVALLADYSYLNDTWFETISADLPMENLGYGAFACFKIVADQLFQNMEDRKLITLLMSLLNDLKSSYTKNFPSSVIIAHKHNVRLFLRENGQNFILGAPSVVVKTMLCVVLDSEFDDYEGVVHIIERLPIPQYKVISNGLRKMLRFDSDLEKTDVLNYVLPMVMYPCIYEPQETQIWHSTMLMCKVLQLFMKVKPADSDNILKIICMCSDHFLGIAALKRIFLRETGGITSSTFMTALYNKTNKLWNEKDNNIYYITLMCKLFTECPEAIGHISLNQFRRVCATAPLCDIKSFLEHFKSILCKHSNKQQLVAYILDIIVKAVFRPEESSDDFARELHDFIFFNISPNNNDEFIWSIVNSLLTPCFNPKEIFKKFDSLGLLKMEYILLIVQHKIKNARYQKPALSLILTLCKHLTYYKSDAFDGLLEAWYGSSCPIYNNLNLVLRCIIHALTEKERCNFDEQKRYRRLQLIVYTCLFNQWFPTNCVAHGLVLLEHYARLLEDGEEWADAIFSRTEESLCNKLVAIKKSESVKPTCLYKDVTYISIFLQKNQKSLNEFTMEQFMCIMNTLPSTPQLIGPDILQTCILLYTNICLQNLCSIIGFVKHLRNIKKITRANNVVLKIMQSLYAVCDKHLDHFKPLILMLFENISSLSSQMRFNVMTLIIKIFNKKQSILDHSKHYFAFFKLLGDQSTMIKHHMEVFVEEKFSQSHYEMIKDRFVSGLIHYNQLDHQLAISLAEGEQKLVEISNRVKARCRIYYNLYRSVPADVQFSILEAITTDILIKITSKALQYSEDLLEDTLIIILFNNSDKSPYTDMMSFYKAGLENIQDNLLTYKCDLEQNVIKEDYHIIGKMISALFHILYGEFNTSPKLCQNLLFTIINLTATFFNEVQVLICQDEELTKLYQEVAVFHRKMQDAFAKDLLTVNPESLGSLSSRDALPFYYPLPSFNLLTEDNINAYDKM